MTPNNKQSSDDIVNRKRCSEPDPIDKISTFRIANERILKKLAKI